MRHVELIIPHSRRFEFSTPILFFNSKCSVGRQTGHVLFSRFYFSVLIGTYTVIRTQSKSIRVVWCEIQRSKRINNSIAAPAKQSQVTLSFQETLESTSAINSLNTSSSMSPSHRGPEIFRCAAQRTDAPRNPSAAIGSTKE